jgi:hypothetical protein
MPYREPIANALTSTKFVLPTYTISDYVEMSFYLLLILFGGSINSYVLRKLVIQYRLKTVIEHKVHIT